jgi:hypothetical protein
MEMGRKLLPLAGPDPDPAARKKAPTLFVCLFVCLFVLVRGLKRLRWIGRGLNQLGASCQISWVDPSSALFLRSKKPNGRHRFSLCFSFAPASTTLSLEVSLTHDFDATT